MTLTPDELEAAAEKYFIAAFDEGSKTARQVARDAYLAGALHGKKLGREEMLAEILRLLRSKEAEHDMVADEYDYRILNPDEWAAWLEQKLKEKKCIL